MSKNGWSANTLKTVQALWALGVGTIVILAAVFFVLPHVMEDGELARDDLWLVAGTGLFGALIAFPSAVFQAIGKGVEALKAWRSGGKADS